MLVLVMDSFLMCIKYANPIVVLRSLLAGGPFMNRHGPSLLASRLHRQGMRCPGWPKAAASHYISEATLPLSFEQERNRHRVLRHTISCQIWDLAHTLTPVLFWNGATWLLCLSAAWFLWTARQLHHYWLHLLPVKLASRFLHQATLSLLMPLQIARWKSTPDCITSYLGHSTALKLYTNQSNYDYGHAGEVPASAEITYRACSPFIEDTCAQTKNSAWTPVSPFLSTPCPRLNPLVGFKGHFDVGETIAEIVSRLALQLFHCRALQNEIW